MGGWTDEPPKLKTRWSSIIYIEAAPATVWRALCDLQKVVQWDMGVIEAIDAPSDYPKPGQHVRWRYRSRLWRVLHDRPVDVQPERCLRSMLTLGPYKMDETYEFSAADNHCWLTLTVILSGRVPLLGSLIVGRKARDIETGFESSLASLKRYSETQAPEESSVKHPNR